MVTMSTVDSQDPVQGSLQEPAEQPTPINPTSASLLGFLYWRPMSGGGIVAAGEGGVGHFWDVTPGPIFPEPQTPARSGLVERWGVRPPRRGPYAVPDPGRGAVL